MTKKPTNEQTFVKITNKMIYQEIKDNKKFLIGRIDRIEDQLIIMNGNVKTNRRWLLGLTTTFGGAFIFVVGWLIRLA